MWLLARGAVSGVSLGTRTPVDDLSLRETEIPTGTSTGASLGFCSVVCVI